jgi:hypothetical protein
MKLNIKSAALSFITITPALACLQVRRGVIDERVPKFVRLQTVDVVDNGLLVCSADWDWTVDKDLHFSIKCLPGYAYAVTKDGTKAWYSNPKNNFSFYQTMTRTGYTVYFGQEIFGCPGPFG